MKPHENRPVITNYGNQYPTLMPVWPVTHQAAYRMPSQFPQQQIIMQIPRTGQPYYHPRVQTPVTCYQYPQYASPTVHPQTFQVNPPPSHSGVHFLHPPTIVKSKSDQIIPIKKQNCALAIIDPKTRKPINAGAQSCKSKDDDAVLQSRLNSNCKEFIPQSQLSSSSSPETPNGYFKYKQPKMSLQSKINRVKKDSSQVQQSDKQFQPTKILSPPKRDFHHKHNRFNFQNKQKDEQQHVNNNNNNNNNNEDFLEIHNPSTEKHTEHESMQSLQEAELIIPKADDVVETETTKIDVVEEQTEITQIKRKIPASLSKESQHLFELAEKRAYEISMAKLKEAKEEVKCESKEVSKLEVEEVKSESDDNDEQSDDDDKILSGAEMISEEEEQAYQSSDLEEYDKESTQIFMSSSEKDKSIEDIQFLQEECEEISKPLVEMKSGLKLFHRYNIKQLKSLQNSSLVSEKPPPLRSFLFERNLKSDVYRILIKLNSSFNYKTHQSDEVEHGNSRGKDIPMQRNDSKRFSESFTSSNRHHRKVSPKQNRNRSMINESLCNDDVKLNVAENAWKPSTLTNNRRGAEFTEQNKIDKLIKQFRSFLNKLTAENFEIILEEVKGISINTKDEFEAVVNILFEKSISEPGYASTYAEMCKILSPSHKIKNSNSIDRKNKNQLKFILILRCQREFEQTEHTNKVSIKIDDEIDQLKELLTKVRCIEEQLKGTNTEDHHIIKDELMDIQEEVCRIDNVIDEISKALNRKRDEEKSNDDSLPNIIMSDFLQSLIQSIDKKIIELDEFHTYIRRRSNGTVKFIGELFKARLLTTKIMRECITLLMPPANYERLNEDNIERLCKLLTTIGQEMDAQNKEFLNETFVNLNKLLNSNPPAIKTSRIKFDVMNIIDLRNDGWKARINQRATEIKVMKLDDLTEQLLQKERDKEILLQNYEKQHERHSHNAHQYHNYHDHGHNQYNNNSRHHHNNNNKNNDNYHRRNHNAPHPHPYSNRQKQQNEYDKDGFLTVKSNTNFDFNRIPLRRADEEVKLEPSHFGNFFNFNKRPQQSQYHQNTAINSNPFNQLAPDSDGSDALNRMNVKGNNKLHKSNIGKIVPPGTSLNELKDKPAPFPRQLKPFLKAFFVKKLTAVYYGEKSVNDLIKDVDGCTIDTPVLYEICTDYFDKKEDERLCLIDVIDAMLKHNIITKQQIIEALEEIMKNAEDIAIDSPHVYIYTQEYFKEMLERQMLTFDEIKEICKSDIDKFSELFKSKKVVGITKEVFAELLNAEFAGRLTEEQFMSKMEKFVYNDADVLCDVISYYFDKKENERVNFIDNIIKLSKKGLIGRELIVTAFAIVLELAPEFEIDIPHVYSYIKDFFVDLMKANLLDLKEIEDDICKFESNKAHFTEILGIPMFSSTPSKSHQYDSPKTPHEIIHETIEEFDEDTNKNEEKDDEDDDLKPPEGVKVGSFKKIAKKVEFALTKNLKKNEFNSVYKLIDEEKCIYETTFIQDITELLLKIVLSKLNHIEQVEKVLHNKFDVIKRFVDSSITRQTRCIVGIQKFVCNINDSNNKDSNNNYKNIKNPKLLAKLFEIFYENEVICIEAFKKFQRDLSAAAKNEPSIKETQEFFRKLESL